MENIIWDPVNRKLTLDSYAQERKAVAQKLQTYIDKPTRVRRFRLIFVCIAILGVVLFGLGVITNGFSDNNGYVFILILSLIPISYYMIMINHLQDEVIYQILCENNKWLFRPEEDFSCYKQLVQRYTYPFDQGDNQTIIDQIWGNVKFDRKADFWMGTFQYTVGSGKSQQTIEHPIFILELERTIPDLFSLETKYYKVKEDFKTESNEFNNKFKIIVNRVDNDTGVQIMKVLSPSVQVRLIDFANKYPVAGISFQGKVMILDFYEKIWSRKYTNFFKKVTIDKRDEEIFFSNLNDMFDLSSKMIQYI